MVELLLWLHITKGGVLEVRTCTCRTEDLHRTSFTIMMPRTAAVGLTTTLRAVLTFGSSKTVIVDQWRWR